MPIVAIPPGVELRKISAVQKRALDELVKNTNGSTTKNTALLVGVPVAFAAIAGLIYIFKDELKETVKDSWDDIKQYAEGIPAGVLTGAIDAGFGLGKEITGVDLQAVREAEVGTIFEGTTVCERYEYDLVDLYGRDTNIVTAPLVGLSIREKLKGMKKAGCDKPPYVPQIDWDRV